ncbi:MAG TPA: isopentenyl-diphosphate Delta-isomerase [Candidatus Agrococcus pullicola]|uniref:Isopentenyl-diphosphate Delta-isomerase n=1 Tax=Candidatus Agrococcus pullicola TaxID=2838429 RepID=A0A9D1YTD9_9MICO|nr:isopentenyl-diphosphate Delta-isomerase [Candidatus Agrococcus pullicola]
MNDASGRELVVLLDDNGRTVGTAEKEIVHSESTPLHLAFSCHITDGEGRMIVTRRALSKRTWPGVWSNACCGHPTLGEAIDDAVHRRVGEELGASIKSLELILPNFAYRAVDHSGIIENERCPVFSAKLVGPLNPDPEEVIDWRWVEAKDLLAGVRSTPWAFSPWMVMQLERMPLQGTQP